MKNETSSNMLAHGWRPKNKKYKKKLKKLKKLFYIFLDEKKN